VLVENQQTRSYLDYPPIVGDDLYNLCKGSRPHVCETCKGSCWRQVHYSTVKHTRHMHRSHSVPPMRCANPMMSGFEAMAAARGGSHRPSSAAAATATAFPPASAATGRTLHGTCYLYVYNYVKRIWRAARLASWWSTGGTRCKTLVFSKLFNVIAASASPQTFAAERCLNVCCTARSKPALLPKPCTSYRSDECLYAASREASIL
jgi:hypothetical protein